MKARLVVSAITLSMAIATTTTASPPPTATSSSTSTSNIPLVEMADRWTGTSFGGYLPPKGDFIDADGGVDLVFHFNAAMLADKSWRRSNMNAVIVSQAFGDFGTSQYDDHYADRARFGRMVDEVLRSIGRARSRENLHARHITLVGWSAGFAAVGKILGVQRYFDMVDSIVLLDGLHARYLVKPNETKHPYMGVEHVDKEQLSTFIRFAREAADGKKQMIVTHTNIMTPDYATSKEACLAMLGVLGIEPRAAAPDEQLFGMTLRTRADKGGLHVLGFRGNMPSDHMDHLYAVGDVMRTWIAPRIESGGAASGPRVSDSR
jgi:hypothetical protein